MRYLLAIVLPPVAVLVCGRPIVALLNLLLTLLGWIPGIVHALFVVSSCEADKRNKKLIGALQQHGGAAARPSGVLPAAGRTVMTD